MLYYFILGLGGRGGVAVFVVFPSCILLGLLVPVGFGGTASNLSFRIISLLFLYNSFRWRWRDCISRVKPSFTFTSPIGLVGGDGGVGIDGVLPSVKIVFAIYVIYKVSLIW